MPILFLYLSKLSICLAVVYLFYRLLLQRLTFYNWNRWYLLGYSFLSIFIPFINISQVLEQNKWSAFKPVQAIPVITDLSSKNEVMSSFPAATRDIWDVVLLIFIAGTLVMFARFILQWLSYVSIKRKARILVNDHVNVYEVSKDIAPFSFGRSVFINPQLHNPEELKEILRHEYVHVRQKHTIDIVWAEVLCLFNWYNPFAWLIRHSIRQNLEFIADNKVIENGMDKKQYQYLLLKVMGIPQFHIAAPFNFSSLKKRIVMMNKIKSAKAHLIKFLFMIPLLAVLLLAFRVTQKKHSGSFQNKEITISGIVMQADNYMPLSNVHFKEAVSRIEGSTNDKGFYTFTIPVTGYPYKTSILFTKEGYENVESKLQLSDKSNFTGINAVEFIGMIPEKTRGTFNGSFVHDISLPRKPAQQDTYALVANKFEEMKRSREESVALHKQSADSEKPYWVINGHTYILTADGGSASWDTITNIVIVDGKKMTGEEVNAKFKRSMIHNVSAIGKENAQKKYGINQEIIEIFITTQPGGDTVPKAPAN